MARRCNPPVRTPKKQRKATVKRYTEETLSQACAYVDNGEGSLYDASHVFNIPYSTLYARYRGIHTSRQAAHEHEQYLSDEEEGALRDWLDHLALRGFPADKQTVLDMAQAIFEDMKGGWDDVCGGGIWWSKDRNFKNAIANELYLSVAASLANRAANKQYYLDIAVTQWNWFKNIGLINSDNLINDGLDDSCHNNGQKTWSCEFFSTQLYSDCEINTN